MESLGSIMVRSIGMLVLSAFVVAALFTSDSDRAVLSAAVATEAGIGPIVADAQPATR